MELPCCLAFGQEDRRPFPGILVTRRATKTSDLGPARFKVISALPPKADMCSALTWAGFGPKVDMA